MSRQAVQLRAFGIALVIVGALLVASGCEKEHGPAAPPSPAAAPPSPAQVPELRPEPTPAPPADAKPDTPVSDVQPDPRPAAAEDVPSTQAEPDAAPATAADTVVQRTEDAAAEGDTAAPKSELEEPTGAERGDVAVFVLEGDIVERTDPFAWLDLRLQLPLRGFVEKINEMTALGSVSVILLRIGQISPGPGQLAEMRDALIAARKEGVHVVSHLATGDQTGYLLACAGDEIIVAPAAGLDLHGLEMDVVYFRGLLDKIGVEADFEAIGRYKTATEVLSRTGMSPEQREELTAYADALYEDVIRSLTLRDIEPDRAESLIDAGPYTTEEARNLGLVDGIETWVSLRDRTLDAAGGEMAVTFPEAPERPDLTSFVGLFSLLTDVPGKPPAGRRKIAVLYATGPIIHGDDPEAELWGSESVQSGPFVRTIEALARDSLVEGVVLRVDSPGGSPLAAEVIWQALRRLREVKPLVASLGNVAASGGYYIATAADVIYVDRTTLTGSIGVFGGKLVVQGLHDLLGLSVERIARGQNAGLFSPYSRFNESERERLRTVLSHIYDRFIARVAEGRGLETEAVAAVAEGRVWTGSQAVVHGLADEIGGIADALRSVRERAEVPPTLPAYSYPAPRSLLDALQSGPQARAGLPGAIGAVLGRVATPSLQMLNHIGADLAAAALRVVRLLRDEPVLAHTPWILHIR